ncbi:MAG TPA: sigma-54 dependent transcriptional regulator [Syntrophomonas sp.]|nr:sigma-54 dependent transcriptional regulator [Syntrophomonas sp.]
MKILLVDDDPDSRYSAAKFLSQLGHEVIETDSAPKALNLLAEQSFPMVLSDIRMPGMSGIELLKAISALPSEEETNVVLLTGYGDMDSAIDAFRAGAFDYLLKPIKVKELALITQKIEAQNASQMEKDVPEKDDTGKKTNNPRGNLSGFKRAVFYSGLNKIGIFSESMLWLVKQAYLYHQDRSIPVLIHGETGTGKEVIARIIHFGAGEEPAPPFIAINCAAITSSLFESELFGYEAGAFTGGVSKGQKGKCDLAKGGTLFLDEVSEIPLELQGKLLRAIQEKCYYRVGGLQEIKMDTRFICSTNANLDQMVAKGTFRKDLYYRLKVGSLFIPPLRQRKEDILPLGNLFLWDFSQQKGKRFVNIGNQAAKILLNYSWPGNVRELRNLMEWIVFMFDDIEVKPQHLNLSTSDKHKLPGFMLMAADYEDDNDTSLSTRKQGNKEYSKEILLKALEAHNGNKTEAARFLGISRTTLYNYLKNIDKE